MSKKKAFICATLYLIVLVGVLTASHFIKNDDYGISLYQIIMCAVGNMWFGFSVSKFYNWLIK